MAAPVGRAGVFAALCVVLALGTTTSAQHFGQNRVRYRTFQFEVLKTEHFDIYFYSSEREGIEIAARLAERWYLRLERFFGHPLSGRQPLILYASHTDFEQTNVLGESISEGTGGVTEPTRRRVILPLAGPIADTDHVLGHEIVHAFQFDIAGGQGGEMAMAQLPLWFIEGMAEYASLGPVSASTAIRIRDVARQNRLPAIDEMDRPQYFPYHWGHAFFAYVASRYGDAVIPQLLFLATGTGDLAASIKIALGVTVQELSADWHASIKELYAPAMEAAEPLAEARRVISTRPLGGELNIGPVLSPNGRLVAFLSARGVFSTDLYIADVETGHIRRRLTSTATSPRYSTIQFIHSAGAWDPAGERIAVATIASGHPALAIFNALTGKRDRDIVIDDTDEILNPSWSPDGNRIAMTGVRQGLTDLFVYDLRSGKVEQITRDAYADIHPSWSPDGLRIAFATDRFTSDLTTLDMGSYRLGIVNVATHAIEQVPVFEKGKHINPQWSTDGGTLFFIAEPDGIPNVYRLVLATNDIGQISSLATGVAGITQSSPAISVSRNGRLAMGVFEDDRYEIYVRPTAAPTMPPKRLAASQARLAPPAVHLEDVVTPLLGDPAQGLPASQEYPTEPYKPKLSLQGFGQPTAGVGTGRFGTMVGGGAAVYFADMLGDHLLATAVQVNSGLTDHFSFNDITFEAGYFNLKRRWNWGLVGGQIPYVTGGIDNTVVVEPTGEITVTDRQIIYRQTQRNASAVLSYPFNRAHRVEVHGGFSQTTFEQIVKTLEYSNEVGFLKPTERESRLTLPNVTLATSSIALVRDTASFGPTSPVQGERYRLEVSPALGTINFVGVLADYRRYTMPAPFYTIAARVLHYGRYGEGSDDDRLYPLYVNDPYLVRGYDTYEYATTDCLSAAQAGCQVNSRFVGSRMLVANLELRMPLLRPLGLTQGMYSPVPVELAVFADSGVAWHRGELPAIAGGSRAGISSAGVAFRMSLGVAVLEFNVTRPFQSLEERWVFGFNLLPGW